MRRWTKFVAVAAALATVGVGLSSSPVSSAEGGQVGYTVVASEGGCELQSVDLATGVLTDLPAAAAPAACVADLAVGADGVVYGLLGSGGGEPASVPAATDVAFFVTFAADGTPQPSPILVDGELGTFLARGGIAIASDGTVYLNIVTDEEGCDTSAVCLYTYDVTTGAATFVGNTDLFETYFDFLTSCAGTLRSIAEIEDDNGTFVTEDPSTGAATPGADSSAFLVGYDCASNATTLYALAAPEVADEGEGPITPLATDVVLGTVDPSSGAFSAIAPLSDAGADVYALAVGPMPLIPVDPEPPAVNPDDTAQGAAPVQVTPAFTG